MKPSPNERAGVRSATLKGSSARASPASIPMADSTDSDGRAVFTGAANQGTDVDDDDGQGNRFSNVLYIGYIVTLQEIY